MSDYGDARDLSVSSTVRVPARLVRLNSVSGFARFTMAAAAIGVGISYSKIYLFHFCALFFVSLLLIRPERRFVAHGSRRELMFVFMLFWSIISLAWSWDRLFGINYVVYITSGLIVVLASLHACKDIESQKKTYKLLSVVFLVELGISSLEALGVFRFPISSLSPYVTYFGRMSATESGLSSSIVSYLQHMPTGFEWNPNNLALLVVMLLPFFIFHKSKIASRAGVLLCLVLIIMASSRGVWLASMLVLAISYFIKFERKKAVYIILVMAFLGGIILFFTLFANDQHPKIRDIGASIYFLGTYFFGSSSDLDLSILERREWIALGMQAFRATWGMGIGAGGHNELLGGASMHNYWIEILTDGGVIVFVPYFTWLLSLFFSLLRARRRTLDPRMRYYATACAMSLLGFTVGCISASTVIYFFPKWILYGFSIATIYNSKSISSVSGRTLEDVQQSP